MGTHSFEGISPLWPTPPLPGKTIKLFFSISPKTLSLRFNLVSGAEVGSASEPHAHLLDLQVNFTLFSQESTYKPRQGWGVQNLSMMSFPGVLTLQPGPFSILVHPSLLKDSPLGVQEPPAVSLQLWGQSPSPCHLPQGKKALAQRTLSNYTGGEGWYTAKPLSVGKFPAWIHHSNEGLEGSPDVHPSLKNNREQWKSEMEICREHEFEELWTWSFADSRRNSLSQVAGPTV